MKNILQNHSNLAISTGIIFLLATFVMIFIPNPTIHPIVFLGAQIFILYPFRNEILARKLIQLGVITIIIWLPINLSGVLFPFIFAFIFAYLCAPIVEVLEKRGFPRWLSSLLIILIVVGILTLFFIFVIPTIIDQFNQLLNQTQAMVENTNYQLEISKLKKTLNGFGIPQKQVDEIVSHYIEPSLKEVGTWIFSRIGFVIKNLAGILEGVFNLILIPLLSFYILKDFRKFETFTRTKILVSQRGLIKYLVKIDDILSSYIRGILLTSSLVGIVTTIILSIFNTPFAIVIGILTGVLNLIPSVGMLINIGVAALVYLFTPGDFWTNTIITASVIIVLHAVNAYVIEPKIIGHKLGLHPVILLASLFICAHLFGFLGLLFGVPLAAIIVSFINEWWIDKDVVR